jgi:tRNA-binding protein
VAPQSRADESGAANFAAVDIRVGTVLTAEAFAEARKPAIKLTIDFGPDLGVRRSSAQLTVHYTPQQLVGKQVIAAVNLGARRIAGFESEVLVLGATPSPGSVILLATDQPVPDGSKIS